MRKATAFAVAFPLQTKTKHAIIPIAKTTSERSVKRVTEKLKLPVGIDSFEKIRKDKFYYIDKTKLIEQLIAQWGEVNLFTRPRRFGKTLNMSMLRCFFEIGTDSSLFDGLYISKNKELCKEYLGKFPVIFISLKNVDGFTFEEAKERFAELIGMEAERFSFLDDSDKLSENEKRRYRALIAWQEGRYSMEGSVLTSSLQILSQLLAKYYGRKTIILIDEYDVPLDKAFQHGYYQEMVSLIRGIFGQALKTNSALQFAVLTGCLRISKESIFTGLNNFKVLSITDARFDEQFGFTDAEVKQLLESYQLTDHFLETKEWYDGYRFGEVDVYCPWDVINHVDRLLGEPEAEPQSYWINSSGNELVKRFVDKADKTTRDEIERLIAGEAIEKAVRLELTYDEIDNDIDNLWSVLFTTGYLTQQGKIERGVYKLLIPNKEVRDVFIYQIQEWFRKNVVNNTEKISALCEAFSAGDSEEIQKQLNRILSNMISILDTKAREGQKENFYHGLLLGLLRNEPDWLIQSNVETVNGFCDILIEPEDPETGIIIEVKYAASFQVLEKASRAALDQIRDRNYEKRLQNEGRNDIWAYGISFCRKRCRVIAEKL